ncbi:hypothetical protein ACQ4PT_030899 [Festuca glaucescens]
MSTSALLSALRVGGRQKMTASTFGARAQATGSHVFRIHRFTHVREKVANGTAVQSGTFGVGGHDWRVNCYPNGNGEQNQGCISLYLRHASHAKSGDATVKYKMSILNQAWKPSGTLSDEHRFTGNGTTCKRLQASIVHPPVGIMSTSALLSALRVGGRQKMTASTFGARAQATGSHVFRIHRFTHVREKVANGTAVQSGTFGVGGHDWRVNCYPNGNGEQNQGCISLYLRHASHAKSGDATVKYKMSILNQAWKPSGTLSDEHRFTGNGLAQ